MGDLDVNGRTILLWIVRKLGVRMWVEFILVSTGPVVVGPCENNNETLGSAKDV
jgi:hypothetical protein